MLKEIELPPCISAIGWQGFKDCHNLEKVVLPEGMTGIGSNYFESCYELKELKRQMDYLT